MISIHALREEGDVESCSGQSWPQMISIHALREEGDQGSNRTAVEVLAFLSTPSARRATLSGDTGARKGGYFYPRPPRGGRLPVRSVFDGVF